jgi:rhodanese-related sulfurtransferase
MAASRSKRSIRYQKCTVRGTWAVRVLEAARYLRHGLRRGLTEEEHMASIMEQVAAAKAVIPAISPQEAAQLQAKGALIVDVRDAPELQASGKVKGALHVSRGMLEFKADPKSPYHDQAFDPNKTVILYCASGGRSALSGKALKELGFKDVRNLGAFKDWAESGQAVEKI